MELNARDPLWFVPLVERHRVQLMADLVALPPEDVLVVLRKLQERLEQETRRVETSRTGSWRVP